MSIPYFFMRGGNYIEKNIIKIFCILFILFFILWASGFHLWEVSALLDEPKGLEGCFRGSAIQSRVKMRTNTEQMRQNRQEKTGQSFEGWTLYEMQLMAMELDRLEKERREGQSAQTIVDTQDNEDVDITAHMAETQEKAEQQMHASSDMSYQKHKHLLKTGVAIFLMQRAAQ